MDAIDTDIVLVGCGKMGSALGTGLVESGRVAADHLYCCDREFERAELLAESAGAETLRTDQLFPTVEQMAAPLVVVAVKPKDLQPLLEEGAGHFESEDTLVSIAAGVPTDCLAEWSGGTPRVVRAMPNVAALIGAGITGIYSPGSSDLQEVRAVFEAVGSVVELEEEDDFDALTAVSGSGPAYVFTALEALADGAVSEGLDRETARTLAVETLSGAAALARKRAEHTAQLKDEVTSPGGTTAAGLVELERKGFRSALIDAVREAAQKSREMTSKLVDD